MNLYDKKNFIIWFCNFIKIARFHLKSLPNENLINYSKIKIFLEDYYGKEI